MASLESLTAGALVRGVIVDGDGDLLRLTSKAQRSGLGHLFDPVLGLNQRWNDTMPSEASRAAAICRAF